jgi:CHAT domain-containing protein
MMSSGKIFRNRGFSRILTCLRVPVQIVALAALASVCGYAQSPSDLLSQADRFADEGNWFKARSLYANAESEFQRTGDHRNELCAKFGRLHGDAESGSYQATRDEVVRELSNPLVQNDAQLKIRALALLGTIDLNLNTSAALEDWKQVLSVATAAGDRKWQNRANGQLGIVAGVNGDIGSAGVALYQAISKAGELGDVAGQVHFATWLANGMSVNGMADGALQILNRATELAEKHGYSEIPLQLSIAKIRALLLVPETQRSHSREEARKLLASTLSVAQKNGVLGAESELLNQAGQLSVEERDYSAAETSFSKAVEIAKAANLPRMEAGSLLHLSQLYRATNHPAKAAPVIAKGIEAMHRVEQPFDLPLFIAENAEVQAALGSLHAADALYDRATVLIEGLLVNAQSSLVKSAMIAAMSDIYVGHFRLTWNRLHDAAKAFRIIESARGRALLDSMRYARQSGSASQYTSAEQAIVRLQRMLLKAQLDDAQTRRVLTQLDDQYFRLIAVEYARSRQEMQMLRRPPVSLAALRRQLARDESLVEYVLDTKASYAVQVTPSGLTVHTLPGRAEINRFVRQYLAATRNKEKSAGAARILFKHLLSPVVTELPSSLIIVPDGPLHLIPFGALVDDKGATINKAVGIAVVPSATIYSMLRTAAPRTIATRAFLGVAYTEEQPKKSLLASNTRGLFDLRGANLKPLPFGREEIVTAAHILGPDSLTLEGGRASETALKALRLGDFKVIHFAAHGVGNELEPDRAGLVLTSGSDAEDGLWQAREIRQARLNADVVVLSACETGAGRLRGEEGVMNLARAFLIAGAKSVVASLWAVDDRSTATLMGFFYEHLAAGLQVREALRQAQMDFIRNYGDKAEPYYWAGFEVIGDGTRRITVKANKPDL